MPFSKSIISLAAITMLSGCIVVASPSHADYNVKKELSLDAENLTKFDIETGAGVLNIVGTKTTSEITVSADIYTDSEHKERYQLELTQSGQTAFLVAKNEGSFGSWHGRAPRIDVTITLPADMELIINDGSGEVTISSINNNVSLTDGSGDIDIRNVTGKLILEDGSGGIFVQHIGGNVKVDDGSGSIELLNISGSVDLHDGSGSILVKNVSGDADISDGSGDVTVRHVSGSVTLDDGSGDIDVEDAGNLKIVESGSGGLRVNKISGSFESDG